MTLEVLLRYRTRRPWVLRLLQAHDPDAEAVATRFLYDWMRAR